MRQKPEKEKVSMLLSTLLSQFADPRQKSHKLAKTTAANYVCRIRRFIRYLGKEPGVSEFARPQILRYLHSVEEGSVVAVRMHLAALRSFARFLKSEGWIRSLPTDNIPLPKATRGRRERVPENVVSQLLDACDRKPGSPYRRALAKAALSLLVYGGLRRAECLALKIEDVRLDTGEVFIRAGKGNKTRSVYVCRECTEAIRVLLKLRPACEHDLLLAYNRRYGLMYHGLRNLIRDLHTIAGIDAQYTPHQLRHACASRLSARGAPLATIQAFLGHERLETTATYLHTNDDDLRAVAHLTSLSPVKSAAQTQTETAPAVEPASQTQRKRFQIERTRRTM